MVDGFGRDITYLRISVTDRCNLRCHYCVASAAGLVDHSQDMLSFDEITEVTRAAVDMGVRKVRITGGEPLLRPHVEDLVRMIARIRGVEDLAMSTNGILLGDRAQALADAGLHRVNISLDAIDPTRYAAITGGGNVRHVLSGIEAAVRAGLDPIKLNCVVKESAMEPDALAVAQFAREHDLEIRFIHPMDFIAGRFSVVEGGSGGDCNRCNRLRLSCDGHIRPCLFSEIKLSVRELGASLALERAICCKPERGAPCSQSWIGAIGG
ncbi:MAG: GTP 3',8-cyclase MoaA [Armatimonadota bacterium]